MAKAMTTVCDLCGKSADPAVLQVKLTMNGRTYTLDLCQSHVDTSPLIQHILENPKPPRQRRRTFEPTEPSATPLSG